MNALGYMMFSKNHATPIKNIYQLKVFVWKNFRLSYVAAF